MEIFVPKYTRRALLQSVALGVTALLAPEAFADELVKTPAQTEGPFYPDQLPLDKDNDLVVIKEDTTQAVGTITQLSGRILDAKGNPLKGATVEIWQVDNNGVYLHSKDSRHDLRDAHFQGYGAFETDSKGRYRFRTIKPVPYPGRTPHIHFAVKAKGREKFVTQCYIKGHPLNEKDGVLKGITDEKQRDSVLIPFTPIKNSKIGEVAAKFDIVLGFTP